jgi:hypothetical protein
LGAQAISLQRLLAASQGNASLLEVLQQIQAVATIQAVVTGKTVKAPPRLQVSQIVLPRFRRRPLPM